jgi:hypothetical protein
VTTIKTFFFRSFFPLYYKILFVWQHIKVGTNSISGFQNWNLSISLFMHMWLVKEEVDQQICCMILKKLARVIATAIIVIGAVTLGYNTLL